MFSFVSDLGYSVADVLKIEKEKFDCEDFLKAGFALSQLSWEYDVKTLKGLGVEAKELRMQNYTIEHLKRGGYNCAEISDAG